MSDDERSEEKFAIKFRKGDFSFWLAIGDGASFLPSRSDIYIKKRNNYLFLDEIERRRVVLPLWTSKVVAKDLLA